MKNIKTKFISFFSGIPIVSVFLRKIANSYKEGSIVRIKSGYAAGMLWKRYHNYVNGYWAGIYELPFQKRIVTELKEGDIFFDVGANAGFFSLIAAKAVGKIGNVVAFEPLPMNARVIREQFEINRLTNCRCICSALGEKKGVCEFILTRTLDGKPSTSTAHLSGYVVESKDKSIMERYSVDVMTLDDFISSEGLLPSLIKIDVEGAEGDVLRGGKKLIQSNRAPRILLETHGNAVAEDINAQLKEVGYRFYSVDGKPLPNGLIERHFLAYPPSLDKSPLKI